MLVLGVIGFLVASIAALPCWSYSQRWGYVPSTISGVLLFFAALVAVGGKPAQSEIAQKPAKASVAEAPVPVRAKPSAFVLDTSRQPIPLLRASAVSTAEASSQ